MTACCAVLWLLQAAIMPTVLPEEDLGRAELWRVTSDTQLQTPTPGLPRPVHTWMCR